jgi:outer membrane protein OmpA-like peptidoglycan-associated protein
MMTTGKYGEMLRAVAVLSLSLAVASPAAAQTLEAPSPTTREIVAFTYPSEQTVSIELEGTSRLPDGNGEAKVERKRGATEIEIELDEMKPARLFGGDFNTYVLWSASPEGQVDNLGELILTGNRSKLDVTTPLDTFGLVVTAEPHYLVGSPSRFVVLENTRAKDRGSLHRTSRISYPRLEGEYRFERASLEGMDETRATVHPHLEEARTAIDLARRAGAERYVPRELERAREALVRAEVMGEAEKDPDELTPAAHEAVRLAVAAEASARDRSAAADEARALEEKDSALAARAREIERKENRIRELESQAAAASSEAERARLAEERERLRAELQTERAAQAERDARLSDDQLRRNEERVLELQREADQAKTDAERSRLLEEQQRLRAELEARRAADAEARARREMAERREAEEEAREARVESEEARRQLQTALERILDVRETARGLIVSVPNVLFDVDRATLTPEGREKLFRVAGILALAEGYRLSVEGHADDTGERDYNLDLSRRRAEAVRDYLFAQGISNGEIRTRGFGEERPIASNETAHGRQQNRRVEIVVEELPGFAIVVVNPTESRD